jgi:outer membrane protein OmpA-like peptidoglycan-associated protein
LSKGISRTRFEAVGLGEDYPIADNSTEDGKARNRRVLIIRID